MSGVFKFKQFDVDQSGCAMKINTDGVLLGALAEADQPQNILDIGTGTGVISLMLAQRFKNAQVDAVEIDPVAAKTAGRNFQNSSLAKQLTIYPLGFAEFFDQYPDKKYDLIVSNPPFYINSLKSLKIDKQLAKHADIVFFKTLIDNSSSHLSPNGVLCLVSPMDTAELVTSLAEKVELNRQRMVKVQSFKDSIPHRLVQYFGFKKCITDAQQFVIYKSVGNYSEEYLKLLKPYFIAF